MDYKMLVIGTSAGGIDAMKALFGRLALPFDIPIVVVQHMDPGSRSYLPNILASISGLPCYEAGDKMPIRENCIYTPAPNYHVLMEKDWTLSLCVGPRVSYARPSIDVFFETAADAVKDKLIGVLLTGANFDGAAGLKAIKDHGGYTLVQDPKEAQSP